MNATIIMTDIYEVTVEPQPEILSSVPLYRLRLCGKDGDLATVLDRDDLHRLYDAVAEAIGNNT
jgi:hypothetical protein